MENKRLGKLCRELGIDKIELRKLIFGAAIHCLATDQYTILDSVRVSLDLLEETIEQTKVTGDGEAS